MRYRSRQDQPGRLRFTTQLTNLNGTVETETSHSLFHIAGCVTSHYNRIDYGPDTRTVIYTVCVSCTSCTRTTRSMKTARVSKQRTRPYYSQPASTLLPCVHLVYLISVISSILTVTYSDRDLLPTRVEVSMRDRCFDRYLTFSA